MIGLHYVYAMFGRRNRVILIASSMLCAYMLMSAAAPAEVSGGRFLVKTAPILIAMQTSQLPTQGVEVEISAPVTATIDNPQLDIRSGALINAHAMRLRMACHVQSECLPFFALAKWPNALDASALQIKLERTSFSAKNDDSANKQPKTEHKLSAEAPVRNAIQPVSLSTQTIARPNSSASIQAGSSKELLRDQGLLHKGSPATLMIEGDRLHISLAVICLEGGSAGDTVRVETPDHKQSYKAQVITDRLLKGNL